MRNRRFAVISVIVGLGAMCSFLLKSELGARPAPETSAMVETTDKAERSPAEQAPKAPSAAPRALVQAEPANERETHSPVEPDEVLETMDRDELTAAIDEIEQDLDRADAVARLNAGRVDDDERVALGHQLERIARLKHQLARLQLEQLTQAVSEYETAHHDRIAKYLEKNK